MRNCLHGIIVERILCLPYRSPQRVDHGAQAISIFCKPMASLHTPCCMTDSSIKAANMTGVVERERHGETCIDSPYCGSGGFGLRRLSKETDR
jgi:hypothetical protein